MASNVQSWISQGSRAMTGCSDVNCERDAYIEHINFLHPY